LFCFIYFELFQLTDIKSLFGGALHHDHALGLFRRRKGGQRSKYPGGDWIPICTSDNHSDNASAEDLAINIQGTNVDQPWPRTGWFDRLRQL
jgi:hypothetical protein